MMMMMMMMPPPPAPPPAPVQAPVQAPLAIPPCEQQWVFSIVQTSFADCIHWGTTLGCDPWHIHSQSVCCMPRVQDAECKDLWRLLGAVHASDQHHGLICSRSRRAGMGTSVLILAETAKYENASSISHPSIDPLCKQCALA